MQSLPTRSDRRLAGVSFMLLASLAFSIMAVAAKRLGRSLSSVEIVFWQNAFGTLWLLLSFEAGGTALAYASLRELAAYYDTRTIVLSFSVTGMIAPILSMVLGAYVRDPRFDFALGRYAGPALGDWAWLLLLSVAALCGQTYITKAYAAARAGVVSAAGYSGVLISLVLGVWLGDGWPDAGALAGIALVVASGVLVSFATERQVSPARTVS